MNIPQAFTVIALGLLLAGCEDGPTLPDMGTEAGSGLEVETAAALEQSAVQAQALVDESLSRMPDGALPQDRVRPDANRDRPDQTDRRRPDDRRPQRDIRAELAVALGAESVAMAERLLEGTNPTVEQLRNLDHAQQQLRRAEAALAEGREGAAVELAQAAQIAALKAVVLPRGVSEEEVRMIHDLAHDLLQQARAAVAADPSEVKIHLLELAQRLFEAGERKLTSGVVRGVVELWKSAAVSSFLIG